MLGVEAVIAVLEVAVAGRNMGDLVNNRAVTAHGQEAEREH